MKQYLEISQRISKAIKHFLEGQIKTTGLVGESLINPEDLKSSHYIDKKAAHIANEILKPYSCNIFIESFEIPVSKDAKFSIYIDPIDGSLNWERGIGDPCVVIAFSDQAVATCLNDLSFANVEGLRSKDVYYTDHGKSYFLSRISGLPRRIVCHGNETLSRATAYLRPG